MPQWQHFCCFSSTSSIIIIMLATTQPLSQPHQLFLQRLMTEHCLDQEAAQNLLQELDVQEESLEDAFSTINRQLHAGFGLEIATVVMKKVKYHAVMNTTDDAVAAQAFDVHFNTHERALIRLILKAFVEKDDDASGLPKKDLINLRNDLEDPYKISSVEHAAHVVEMLLDEKYLQLAEAGGRRDSVQTLLELAPRAYLELSSHLAELGMEDQPQFLFHRGA